MKKASSALPAPQGMGTVLAGGPLNLRAGVVEGLEILFQGRLAGLALDSGGPPVLKG